MQQRLSHAIPLIVFIGLSLTIILAVYSPGSIYADSRNNHNNHNKQSHDKTAHKADSRNNHESHDNASQDNMGAKSDIVTATNQNISCMGSFMNCRNELTNIICSHVTYCFIGPTTPFMMANPTSQ